MTRTIFIGSIYPEPLKDELLKLDACVDFAANTFQHAVLEGLGNYTDVRVISSPVVRMNNSLKKRFAPTQFSHNNKNESCDVYIGTRVGFFSMLYELVNVRRELKKMISECPKADVIIYALHSPFLLAFISIFYFKGCSCVIVPDLPEHMSGNNSTIYRLAKKIDRQIINFCLRRVDKFVLLSPYMKSMLPIGEKPWTLIEGIYNAKTPIANFQKEVKQTLLYTGGISERYGVFDLVRAFCKTDNQNYRLWLCGSCDDMPLLKSFTDKESRIIYYGMVDKDKVIELQQRATVLVNPRHSTEEFTKYSFPSKTMEYMASGTPTLMCKLPAMPDEYLSYIYTFDDESVEGYSRTIKDVLSKPLIELNKKGASASKFILRQKNETIQAKKIIAMLKKG